MDRSIRDLKLIKKFFSATNASADAKERKFKHTFKCGTDRQKTVPSSTLGKYNYKTMVQVYTKLNTNIRHTLGKSESLIKAQLQPQVLTTLTLMCLLKK